MNVYHFRMERRVRTAAHLHFAVSIERERDSGCDQLIAAATCEIEVKAGQSHSRGIGECIQVGQRERGL